VSALFRGQLSRVLGAGGDLLQYPTMRREKKKIKSSLWPCSACTKQIGVASPTEISAEFFKSFFLSLIRVILFLIVQWRIHTVFLFLLRLMMNKNFSQETNFFLLSRL
jgi:hypothetical protein